MSAKLREFLTTLLRSLPGGSRLLAIRALVRKSYLEEVGWFASFERQMPVDAKHQPIPWYTYGAIRFLSARVPKSIAVFEYGSGNSTLWWSRRVQRVISYEHDPQWHALMHDKLPSNVDYHYCGLEPAGEYASRIKRYRAEFGVIVIDGRDRVQCALNALGALDESGVIVWDNSDRSEYHSGYSFLAAHGFKRIDFWGMGPINGYGWCTSIFYRPENCLGI